MSENEKQEELIVHDRRVKEDEPAPTQAPAAEAPEEELKVNDRRVTLEDAMASEAVDEPAAGPIAEDAEDDPRDDPARTCGMPTMPEANFATFVISLSSTCLMHLGEVPSPDNENPCVDLAMAKHIIDTLSMLQEKTKGNLDSDEQRLLEGVLYELRMKFVMRKS